MKFQLIPKKKDKKGSNIQIIDLTDGKENIKENIKEKKRENIKENKKEKEKKKRI